MRNHPRSSVTLLASGLLIGQLAFAAPHDPFSNALPTADTKPTEGLRIAGDPSVAASDGTATYTVPIDVPAGRAGMQPHLALTYSSNGSLRGGIAAGWTLSGLPTIERDPSSPVVAAYQYGGQRIVEAPGDVGTGTRYRPLFDQGMTRIERTGASWTVSTPDGIVRTYAGIQGGSDSASIWNLHKEVDPYGNQVTYTWARQVYGAGTDYVLTAIEYTSNANANLAAHARIEPIYASWAAEYCSGGGVPIGAETDHHFGRSLVRGSLRMTGLRVKVRDTSGGIWRVARQIDLGYDEAELACNHDRPPLRYLTRISTTAYAPDGTATQAAPITFNYGALARDLSRVFTTQVRGLGERGTEHGAESRLMDFDGDGIMDQVRSRMPATGSSRCRLAVRRGLYGGRFALDEQVIELPTAAWDDDASAGPAEHDYCTLDAQLASWGGGYQSTSSGDICWSSVSEVNRRFLDWDHDGDLDLVTWIWRSGFSDGGGDFPRVRSDGDDHGGGGTCGGTEPQATCDCGQGQVPDGAGGCRTECPSGTIYSSSQQQCVSIGGCSDDAENCQDWPPDDQQEPPPPPEGPQGCVPDLPSPEVGNTIRVYYQNDGAFSDVFESMSADVTITNPPQPLPPNGEYLRVEPNGIVAISTLVDIDGDGRLDMLVPEDVNFGAASYFRVWRGRTDGTFDASYVQWPKATWTQDVGTVMTGSVASDVIANTAVAWNDVDGDGLLDIVTRARWGMMTSSVLAVSYNLQGSFSVPRSLGVAGMVETAKVELDIPWQMAIELRPGWRGDVRGLVDLDEDGLDEQFMLSTASGGVSYDSPARYVYRLNGDTMTSLVQRPSIWEPLERLVRAVNRWSWYRVSDFVDLTGDGRPDLVTFDSTGYATVRTDGVDAQPIRLLSTIDNGRGGVTSFTYARSTNPDVVDVETTASKRNDARWVVRSITTNAGSSQPPTTSRYTYAGPVYGVESPFDLAPPHFLGFHKVTVDRSGTQGPMSNRTVTTFIDDGRGHVANEWTYIAAGGGFAPVRYETSTWAFRPLVGLKAGFWYRDSHVTRTCDAGATEAACAIESENKLTERETWTAWTNGGVQAIGYDRTATTREQPGAVRTTNQSFLHRVSATEYRVLGTQVDDLAGTTLLARTQTGYNSVLLPTETYVWTSPFTFARTTRTFDAIGNVLTLRKPNQAASSTPKLTTYTYDGQKLFVTKTVNELGHTVFDYHDVGTGALTRREGPSYGIPPCVTQVCSTTPVFKPEEWSIDGFGRVTQHRVARDALKQVYTLAAVEWTTYVDGVATTRKVEALRDYGGTAKVTSIDSFDGAGRIISHSEQRDASLPNAITTYTYDTAGQLAQVVAPSPVTDGSTVAYRYQRDGLGRMVSAQRPDGTSQLTTYNGLTTETHDVSPSDGTGPVARIDHDPFGRLIAVHEPDASGDHVTTYAYDIVDRMTAMVDADGNSTSITYDLAGHRTRITRGTRSWSYNYDADGNITSEIAPFTGSTDVSTVYSSTTYDELDRPRTHTPGTRGLSSTRLTQLGIGPVTTSYDVSTKALGLPADIAMPLGTIHYDYDARGLVKRETRTVTFTSASHGVALSSTQKVDRTYNALGEPLVVTWDDGTAWQSDYDARGKLAGVAWLDPATATYRPLATYTRLAAGNAVSRTNAFGQRRDWQYDVLGRVTYDRVWKPTTNTSWLERTYTFDGIGHLVGTAGTIGTANADADYAYDGRDRLAVANGPDDYHAQLAYSPAGNITSANVSGADTPARNVTYHYSSVDPQAVDQLIDATNGNPIAQIGYDLPGNAVSRTINGTAWNITPDGDDQIREVSGPTGTERYYFGPRGERIAAIGPEGVKLWFGESETHFTTSGVQSLRWHHIAAGEQLARVENHTSIELQYEDALHNLSLALSTAGNVNAAFTYGGFGEVVSASGAETHRRQFNGKEADLTSGLRHYGYRSYDPVLLRWTAADPKYRFVPDAAYDKPQLANLYAFSMNNPLGYYDPDGRDVSITANIPIKSGEIWKYGDDDVGMSAGYYKLGASNEGVVAEVGLFEDHIRGKHVGVEGKVGALQVTAGKEGVEAEAVLVEASAYAEAGPVTGAISVGAAAELKVKDGKLKIKAVAGLGFSVELDVSALAGGGTSVASQVDPEASRRRNEEAEKQAQQTDKRDKRDKQ